MKPPGAGGDVIFIPGRGGNAEVPGLAPGPDGSIIFRSADGTERLRIDADGEFLVNGNRTAYYREVYESFVAWLAHAWAVQARDDNAPDGEVRGG